MRSRRSGFHQVQDDPRGYYAALGVGREASTAQIHAAYRALARRYHPDHASDPEALERFRRIQEAWEVLRDPLRRIAYDREARARHPGQRADVRRHPVAHPGRLSRLVAWAVAALGAGLLAGVLALGFGRTGGQPPADLAAALVPTAGPPVAGSAPSSPAAPSAAGPAWEATVQFPPGAAELGEETRTRLAAAVSGLAAVLAGMPEAKRWLLVIETYAPRAASKAGVALEDWELALARLAAVIDELVAAGMPPERLAARFHAGLLPTAAPSAELARVRLLLFCCSAGLGTASR